MNEPTTPPTRRTLTRDDLLQQRPRHVVPISLPELGDGRGVVYTRRISSRVWRLVLRDVESEDPRVKVDLYGAVIVDGLCDEQGRSILRPGEEEEVVCGALPIQTVERIATEILLRSTHDAPTVDHG